MSFLIAIIYIKATKVREIQYTCTCQWDRPRLNCIHRWLSWYNEYNDNLGIILDTKLAAGTTFKK